ncbi:MAG: phosphate ABC transporter permease subunit PstC [Defluviicoccus sp.]|nr:phosphate ABC transporter permease subunit PstC [Defluviicoccus sp.]MDG4593318.1 phosphate ABC transporter permease subunit PstC [Defluviicoccus sp.]MDS4009772.1 phosphate ABC transporter permease subunit PstC [Defluviicoccus sp.]MDS4072160.1 phosphate ABC transporter permease subunit PstC [Defluviicoccus sp.]
MASNPFAGAAPADAITRPPSSGEYLSDRVFRSLTLVAAAIIIALVVYILWEIGGQAMPAIRDHHVSFLTSSTWDVQSERFGILPQIWGTLYSSLLALISAGFFGLTVAIFLTQDFLPPKLAMVFRTIIEMLAAIPSVVFGLWGIFVVIPAIRPLADWLHEYLGWIPLFGTSLSGPGLAPATIVLAIMILPTVAAISQDALNLVPYRTKEAAYGMGATRWEAILKVMVPTAAGGILSAMVLGFGRALGETMALAMLIGNSNQISLSLFSPASTLAALLASSFPEAGRIEVQALMYAALVLLFITLVVNIIGTFILNLTQRRISGKS